MADMTNPDPRTLLAEIRRTDAMASTEWLRSYDPNTKKALLSVRESPAAPIEDIAIIDPRIPFDDEQMLFGARKWIRALLTLLDEAFAVIRNQKAEIQILQNKLQNKQHKNAQACAMLCDRGDFCQWLRECHGLKDTADFERVVNKVRSILNVKSRNELDTDPAAAARFDQLKKDFERWKRQ
jgi:hypothetical protein